MLSVFCRFPRGRWPGLVTRRTDLASHFGIGEALAEYVRGDVFEAQPVMLKSAVVVAKHLFVEVTEEMELFDANVGSLESALEQAPEVFESVGVNATVNVPFRMVNDFVPETLVA